MRIRGRNRIARTVAEEMKQDKLTASSMGVPRSRNQLPLTMTGPIKQKIRMRSESQAPAFQMKRASTM